MTGNPKISIITPCLNRAHMLGEAIESVLDQEYTQTEHIIMDGGSIDGTLDLLRSYSHLHVVSEADQGHFDAINKGIQISKGEIIGLLNSDDLYEKNVFNLVYSTFRKHPDILAVVGEACLFIKEKNENSKIIETIPAIQFDQFEHQVIIGTPIINAWFFRRIVFDIVGEFDLNYPIVADREFMLRFLIQNPKYLHLERRIYNYRQHDESLTITDSNDHEVDFEFENLRMIESYLNNETLSSSIYDKLLEGHSFIVSGFVISALRKGSLLRACKHAVYGISHNLAWPIWFISRILSGVSRRVSRIFSLKGNNLH